MKLKNPYDVPHWVPTLGVTVDPGGEVDVDDKNVAESLAAQGWAAVKPKTTKE